MDGCDDSAVDTANDVVGAAGGVAGSIGYDDFYRLGEEIVVVEGGIYIQ